MATSRYTVTLRGAHYLEAKVMEHLRPMPARRRASHLRDLLRLGLEAPVPAMDYTTTAGRDDERMRIELHICEDYNEDEGIASALRRVHPSLVAEFLRDRLVAGLAADPSGKATPAASVASVASISITEEPSIPPPKESKPEPVIVLDIDISQSENTTTLENVGNEEGPPKIRSELLGLFG